jgi:hypothetical protein
MSRTYNPTETEAKWQKAWEDAGAFTADLKKAKKPWYGLVMFPYPSGEQTARGALVQLRPRGQFLSFPADDGP